MNNDYKQLEENIGYTFKNKELIFKAMTHSSYANERKINKIECNERLEFLGDAVLELVSSDFLFKKFPEVPEGKLSKMRAYLVCEPSLYNCSKAISLADFVKLGKGENATGGREKPSVISDAFEALLGAVYLDGGIEEASRIILKFILTDECLDEVGISDSKSYLQELVQADKDNEQITYKVIGESGPEHDKTFEVAVYIGEKLVGSGKGRSKKTAEKEAAKTAIKILKNK